MLCISTGIDVNRVETIVWCNAIDVGYYNDEGYHPSHPVSTSTYDHNLLDRPLSDLSYGAIDARAAFVTRSVRHADVIRMNVAPTRISIRQCLNTGTLQ